MDEFNAKNYYGFTPIEGLNAQSLKSYELQHTRNRTLERKVKKPTFAQEKFPSHSKFRNKDIDDKYVEASNSRDKDIETEVSRRVGGKSRDMSEDEVSQLLAQYQRNQKSPADQTRESESDYEAEDRAFDYYAEQCEALSKAAKASDNVKGRDENPNLEYEQASVKPCGGVANASPEELIMKMMFEGQNTPMVYALPGNEGDFLPDGIPFSLPASPNMEAYAQFPYAAAEMPVQNDAQNMPMHSEMSPGMYYNQNYPQTQTYVDSDLEYEMEKRANYTKHIGPKPKEEDMLNVSQDEGEVPKFLEIETAISGNEVNYLKNTASMRFTDVTSQEEQPKNQGVSTVVVKSAKKDKQAEQKIKNRVEKEISHPPVKSDKQYSHEKYENYEKSNKRYEKTDKPEKVVKKKKHPKENRQEYDSDAYDYAGDDFDNDYGAGPNLGLKTKIHAGYASDGKHSTKRTTTKKRTRLSGGNNPALASSSFRNNKTLKPLVMSPSLEVLKARKFDIFSKMTRAQENIIQMLDTLKISILQICVPHAKHGSKRQKNGFEYSVGFTRNFLCPLRAMMDDIHHIPSDQFNSPVSNEACDRVQAIYTMILHALQDYHKHLQYFMVEQVPKKLITLVQLLCNTTLICLEKNVFDKRDMIIECMQDRSTMILEFLDELIEERMQAKQKLYLKKVRDPLPIRDPKVELKMCMNSLNMYEPVIVPKKKSSGWTGRKSANVGPRETVTMEFVSKKIMSQELVSDVYPKKAVSKNVHSYMNSPNTAMKKGFDSPAKSVASKKAPKKHAHKKSSPRTATNYMQHVERVEYIEPIERMQYFDDEYPRSSSQRLVKKHSALDVTTQMEACNGSPSSDTIQSQELILRAPGNTSNTNEMDSLSPNNEALYAKNEFNKMVTALKKLSKGQIREVLKPILETIGMVLDKKTSEERLTDFLNTIGLTFDDFMDSDNEENSQQDNENYVDVINSKPQMEMKMQTAKGKANHEYDYDNSAQKTSTIAADAAKQTKFSFQQVDSEPMGSALELELALPLPISSTTCSESEDDDEYQQNNNNNKNYSKHNQTTGNTTKVLSEKQADDELNECKTSNDKCCHRLNAGQNSNTEDSVLSVNTRYKIQTKKCLEDLKTKLDNKKKENEEARLEKQPPIKTGEIKVDLSTAKPLVQKHIRGAKLIVPLCCDETSFTRGHYNLRRRSSKDPDLEFPSGKKGKGRIFDALDDNYGKPLTLNPSLSPYPNESSSKKKLSKDQLRTEKQVRSQQSEVLGGLIENIKTVTATSDEAPRTSKEQLDEEVAKLIKNLSVFLPEIGDNIPPEGSKTHIYSASKTSEAKSSRKTNLDDLKEKHKRFMKIRENSIFYENSVFSNPPAKFYSIASSILDNVLGMVEEEFAAGIELFVHEFLVNETEF